MTRPNGVASNYAYDNLSRLLSVLHQLSGSTIDGATYTVDNAGNRMSKTDNRTGVNSNYTYDAIYELTQTTQGGSTTESYSYDPVGNRLSSLGVSSYTNNSSNELTSTSNGSYTYDYNGNTTSKTDSIGTTNYTWDYENRLTQVTLPGTGGTVTFKGDPFGRRIYKSSSSATSIYAYDGNNLIEEVNSSGAVVARYTQGQNIDEPLAQSRSSATSYYEADGLGSVTSLTNASGALAQSYTFDSFGKQTASSGSLTNPFQYTAREFDTETNLYYYRARYHDPAVGRFISSDPVEFLSGVNFYPYSDNSPVTLEDPFGQNPNSCKAKCPGSTSGLLPKTFGVVVTGVAAAGAGAWGGSVATGSAGVVSSASSTQVSAGGGIGTSAGSVARGIPNQNPGGVVESRAYGAAAGGGIGVTWSNGDPCQLRGPFKVMTFDLGLGINFSGSIAFGSNGTYQATFSIPGLSWGAGAEISSVNTNTAVTGP